MSFRDSEAKKTIQPKIQVAGEIITAEFVDRDEYTMFDFKADYDKGRLGHKAVAIVAFDPAKYDAGSEGDPAVAYTWSEFTMKTRVSTPTRRFPSVLLVVKWLIQNLAL